MKVRRGEDWRRSHHNATTQTKGGPRHHTVDDLVLAVRWLHKRGQAKSGVTTTKSQTDNSYVPTLNLRLWCSLQSSAKLCGRVTFFFSVPQALCGRYGRVSGFLMHVGRLLLSAAIFHYVDDLHGVEPEGTAPSAFEGFEELNGLLGCVMKRSKQSPSVQSELAGCAA